MRLAKHSAASGIFFITVTHLVGLRGQDIPSPPQPGSQPCIGFLLLNGKKQERKSTPPSGDVFLTCAGRNSQVTDSGDIVSWAIDVGGSWLATLHIISDDDSEERLEVISLPSRKLERKAIVHAKPRLVSSCGTVLLVDPSYDQPMIDAISGERIPQQGDSAEIRCDNERKNIVSRPKPPSLSGGPLKYNDDNLGTSVTDFEVSPNGRFIGFNNDGNLCVYDTSSGEKSCLQDFRQTGRMSVWVDGQVVASTETGQACPLSSQLITAPGFATWPCPAMVGWQGRGRDQVLQFMATDPQFLPSGTEKLVRNDAKK